MPRKDYDEIKSKFENIVKTFKSKDLSVLETHVSKDIQCFFSVNPSNFKPLGYKQLEDFVRTFPKSDELHLPIYNYACCLNEYEAQAYGQIVAIATNEVEGKNELDFLHFIMMMSLHFKNTEDGWKTDEFKLDVHPVTGNLLDYFKETWYISYPLADYDMDSNIPVIQGEFDSPWLRIENSEDVLTPEEKIKECVAKRFYGIDHFVVDHVIEAYSSKLDVNSKRFSNREGVRKLMSGLRFKRQKDRYWAHPWRIETIKFDGDHAYATTYRVAGYVQRNHEYVWKKENQNIEHMCQECWMEFVYEDGLWRILYNDITLGLYEIGEYNDDCLYGD